MPRITPKPVNNYGPEAPIMVILRRRFSPSIAELLADARRDHPPGTQSMKIRAWPCMARRIATRCASSWTPRRASACAGSSRGSGRPTEPSTTWLTM